MHLPSLTADVFAIAALICVVAVVQMIRLRRSSQVICNGGILVALGLAFGCTLPLLPWADLADEALAQTIAAVELLHAAFVILTL